MAPIERERVPGSDEVDIRYSMSKGRGRTRLLAGMVWTNRPWRLIFGLSSALAAAVASSAFGLSSSTIWRIGDSLSAVHQVLAGVVSVALLVGWLITAHHLWERRRGSSARDREQVVLYNTSTVLTLTVGVGCLYIGLFAVNVGVASYLVPPTLLSSMVGHAGWESYVSLAWAFTTMGVIAGALGSGLESDAAVRQAAYGYRENQRHLQLRRESSDDEQQTSSAASTD